MSNFTKPFFILFLISFNLNSENLLDIYNEALKNDPTFKAAEYSYLADKELVVQGRALNLTQLGILVP